MVRESIWLASQWRAGEVGLAAMAIFLRENKASGRWCWVRKDLKICCSIVRSKGHVVGGVEFGVAKKRVGCGPQVDHLEGQ